MGFANTLIDQMLQDICIPGFFKGGLGTRFGFLELKIESLESEKIGFLESEKSGPYRSIPDA